MSVARDGGAVVVTVAGVLDQAAAVGLRHILTDVMYGQGNLFVRVDFDVLAEASVLAVLSSLDANPEGAGEVEGAASPSTPGLRRSQPRLSSSTGMTTTSMTSTTSTSIPSAGSPSAGGSEAPEGSRI